MTYPHNPISKVPPKNFRKSAVATTFMSPLKILAQLWTLTCALLSQLQQCQESCANFPGEVGSGKFKNVQLNKLLCPAPSLVEDSDPTRSS